MPQKKSYTETFLSYLLQITIWDTKQIKTFAIYDNMKHYWSLAVFTDALLLG